MIDHNQSKAPKMHIAYLMLKENIRELPLLIDLAKEIGIEEIILLNIIQISNTQQDDKRVFTSNNEEPYKELIKETVRKAKQKHIRLAMPRLSPGEMAVCNENPLKNLYISVEGEVSPCVYLYPPVPSPFKRVFCGEEESADKISFGNIFHEPFGQIWNKKAYIEFRKSFIMRQEQYRETCQSFLEMKKRDAPELPRSPLPCRTCHKLLGF